MKILLDTSFIMACVKFKVDFKRELAGNKLTVIQTVSDELAELSQAKGKDSKNAKIALRLIEGLETAAEPDEWAGDADGALLALSRQYVIATQDMPLRRAVKKRNGRVVYIRQRKKIIVE